MKLFRFRDKEIVRQGVVLSSAKILDVGAFNEDWDEHFFHTDGPQRLKSWLNSHQKDCPILQEDALDFAPCISRPSKIVCIGLNYRAHATETGANLPTEPILFMKATSALCGVNDSLIIPKNSEKCDYEVELAVVIGKKASYVSVKEAPSFIAGYSMMNDYSERAFQKERGGQWTKGKSADTFAPLGPYLVLRDALPNPQDLNLWLKVNGSSRQDSTTSDMIFDINFLISYISEFMTLLPGDIISTGTPSGVGLGLKPPCFLKAGDLVEYGIEGIGQAKQIVVNRS